MQPVPFGNTGLHVSPLCFGTGTSGWGGRSRQTGLGHAALVELLAGAAELGVTFWDAADQYGSHPHVRDALRRAGREHITVTTKTVARTPAAARADVDRFRRELGVEQLDILLLHCLTEPDWPERYRDTMDALSLLREQGVVRALGVSCHNFQAFQRAAAEPWVEVVLARVNHANRHMDASWQEVAAVLRQMHAAGKGLYGMKVMGAGDLAASPARNLEFVFGLGCLHAVTIGMLSRRELEENVALVNRAAAAVAA